MAHYVAAKWIEITCGDCCEKFYIRLGFTYSCPYCKEEVIEYEG